MAGKKKKKTDDGSITVANNRKAYHDYTILDEWEAGIALLGSEVKSMRKNKAQIKESYCALEEGELYLINSYIPEYTQAGRDNHAPRRHRKLLVHRTELNKITGKLRDTGVTMVPLAMYFNKRGLVKLKIALVKGKAQHDKREAEKKRDWDRQKARVLKEG